MSIESSVTHHNDGTVMATATTEQGSKVVAWGYPKGRGRERHSSVEADWKGEDRNQGAAPRRRKLMRWANGIAFPTK